jgi:AraC family transcriptional regulator of adaptative response/methylated-DNA-[protein]-cysteine methyltransferase
MQSLQHSWPKARLVEHPALTEALIARIFHAPGRSIGEPLHIYMNGSNFQLKVWEALLRIPPGSVVSYGDIARYLGEPGASRAVGNALARNPVPVIIPCHRVISSLGEFGNYHYGEARKIALLGWEMAREAATSS